MLKINMFMMNIIKTNVNVFQDVYKSASEFIFATLIN